jgi:hypothetical protein
LLPVELLRIKLFVVADRIVSGVVSLCPNRVVRRSVAAIPSRIGIGGDRVVAKNRTGIVIDVDAILVWSDQLPSTISAEVPQIASQIQCQ